MMKPPAILALVVGLSSRCVAQMVGPGGMTTYGGGGRRHGGTVRVREPGKGFFIAGSSLTDMNGVYVTTNKLPAAIMASHNVSLAYENRVTGWSMVLADAQQGKPWRAYGDGKSEWLLIDPTHVDRFGHQGETIIPGSGERWGHLDSRVGKPMQPWEEEEVEVLPDGQEVIKNKVMTNVQMDEWHAARKDQLPWQVIMIGDPDMVRNLESHCSYRARRARDTLRRRSAASSSQPMQPGVPGLGGSTRVFSEAHPPSELTSAAGGDGAGGAAATPDSVVARLSDALGSLEAQQLASRAAQAEAWAEASGGNAVDYAVAAKLYSEAADAATAAASGGGSSLAHLSQWVVASLQFSSGRCWRRSRDLHAAKGVLGAGLRMAPRAVVGLHELALCHLDAGNYDDAKSLWEEVLELDASFPYLSSWLLRVTARARRQAKAEQEQQQRRAQAQAERLSAVLGTPNVDPSMYFAPGSAAGNGAGSSNGPGDAPSVAAALASEPDHYQVLGLAHDFSPEELRKAYRSASLQYHPDKRASGSADAFARVATAHAVLSDVGQRLDFDTAHGMPASNASPENVKDGLGPFLWDEVEELYFPEAVPFWPFGDPFEENPAMKRRRESNKALQASAAAAQWATAHPPLDFASLPSVDGDSSEEME